MNTIKATAQAVKNYLIDLNEKGLLPLNPTELSINELENAIISSTEVQQASRLSLANLVLLDDDDGLTVEEQVELLDGLDSDSDNELLDDIDKIYVVEKFENAFTVEDFMDFIGS